MGNCKVDGCSLPKRARGYCAFHWTRWSQGRDLELPRYYNRLAKHGWIHHGYRWVSTPGGEVMEHRFKMEQALGRKLGIDEVVHHKNSDKTDNRLCNLEVVARDIHTSNHRVHQMTCVVCNILDVHGSHGLCARHKQKVRAFVKRFHVVVPKGRYSALVFYMGLALALESPDVEARIASLTP